MAMAPTPMHQGGGSDNELQLLIAVINSGVRAINALNVTLQTVFPQQGATASTATGGAATLPANPVAFLEAVINGTTYKIPYYAD